MVTKSLLEFLLATNLPTPPTAPTASLAVFRSVTKTEATVAKRAWKMENTASNAALMVENMTSKIEAIRSLMEVMTDVILVLQRPC